MLLRGAAHFIGTVEGEIEQALHLRLLHPNQTAARQVLAQQHAEHRRLGRVLRRLLRQVNARVIGRSRQQKPSAAICAAHGQNQRIALRLLHLVHAAAEQLLLQLLPDGSQK